MPARLRVTAITSVYTARTQRGALGLGYEENAFVAEIGMQMSVGRAGAISLDWQGLSGDNRSQHNLAAIYRLSF